MIPDSFLISMLLLIAPPGSVNIDDDALFHTCAPAIRTLAISWEILDPSETSNFLVRAKDFAADLKILQERWRELANAPRLYESYRFPERSQVNDLIALNRSFHNTLTQRLELDRIHAEELQIALEANDRLHQIWEAAREARCGYYYVTARRQALSRLRDLVGMEAFYSGQLPPCVPLWCLPEQ